MVTGACPATYTVGLLQQHIQPIPNVFLRNNLITKLFLQSLCIMSIGIIGIDKNKHCPIKLEHCA
jgi:hypothetical protein